jgi:hypothetical protein
MKIEKSNLVLTIFIGIPISLVAIFLSIVALWGAFANLPKQWNGNYLGLMWVLPGIFGLLAVFTGIRNLLYFDTAHLHLRWHDWWGGVFGVFANTTILSLILYAFDKQPVQTWWLLAIALPVAGAPIICFCIVAYRYIKHRRQLT